nr:MAG TPA_asm: hypothetical protein [Caudoviricetes sp.]
MVCTTQNNIQIIAIYITLCNQNGKKSRRYASISSQCLSVHFCLFYSRLSVM